VLATDIVIVTANTRDVVLECLAQLDGDPIERVTVVDNASNDGTQYAVARRFPQVDVARLDEGVGYAAACNAGARRGAAELLLVLNSDVVATHGAIATLVAALEERPGAVAAGGRLVDPGTDETQVRYAPKRFPGAWALAVKVSGLEAIWPGNPWTRAAAGGAGEGRDTVGVDQPAGACLLIRRADFAAIGGFDERFWFWYEDVDLARRLSERGELLYVPSAAFEHLGGRSFEQWDEERSLRSLLHGIVRYAEAHHSRAQRVALGMVLAMTGGARSLLFGLTSDPRAGLYRDAARAGRALVRGRRAPDLAAGPG
jgi:GT2 family glycosyltransferase